MPDIKAIQTELRAGKIDGWLFYDHHHRTQSPAASRPGTRNATRRWFYLIRRGEPRKLVHKIEQGALDSLTGPTGVCRLGGAAQSTGKLLSAAGKLPCSIRLKTKFHISDWWTPDGELYAN